MTSILTNAGAISALQTLRSIDSSLQKTQRQVSSGLRVQVAADNAAYWSIATTMRSDNMALSAVHDALGLGAAKVDTAYAGIVSVVSVISEMKSRIVAASESGVDREKVQLEIEQLKDQLSSIVTSASFNGVNWLSTDVPDASVNKASVMASLVRDGSGSIGTGTIPVDLGAITLFNTAGDGLLQKTPTGGGAFGGFENITTPVDTLVFTGPFKMNDGDEFQFDIQDGADTYTATVSKSVLGWDGVVKDMSDFWSLLSDSSSTAGRGIFGISNGNSQKAFGNDFPNPVLFSNFRVTSTGPSMTIMDVDVTTEGDLRWLLSRVDGWLEDTTSAAASLGTLQSRIEIQTEFADKIMATMDLGIGRLVDVDMNQASTRLKAIQAQHQLAIQSLSIANTNAEQLTQLFR